ncbi:hypothetical protein VPH35_112709 [Triticum aestivum]
MSPSSARHPRSRRRDWANLDAGPAGLVAEHVLRNDLVDLVRFRATCRPWRACSGHLRPLGVLDRRFHPRRWIMLPNEHSQVHNHNRRRRFLNVFTGRSIYQALPDPYALPYHVVATTSEGLVLRLSTSVGQLLNPLTGQIAELPSAATLLDDWDVGLVGLELRGAGIADDGTVVLHFRSFYLAIAKPGDQHWTHIHSRDRIISVLPFAGRVYFATPRNISLVETQTSAENKPPQLVVSVHHELHEGLGSLKNFKAELCRGRSKIECTMGVYGVDLDAKNMVPLHGLDGKVLFLGKKRRPLMVSAGVSPSISTETAYMCLSMPKVDAAVYAFDIFGRSGCAETKFKKDDTAYYLSCYVSNYSSEIQYPRIQANLL